MIIPLPGSSLEYIITFAILFHSCSNFFTRFTEKYVSYELSKKKNWNLYLIYFVVLTGKLKGNINFQFIIES